MTESTRIIDSDGHVWEDADGISEHLPSPYKEDGPFSLDRLMPSSDHFHFHVGRTPPGSFRRVGPDGWLEFLDDVGIERTVLYPSRFLAYGNIPYRDWAIAACQGYNNWLHETYVARSTRFQGMAIIPMQDPSAAVDELHRAVEELGMVGAMIPSNGLGRHLGSKEYWPVYRAADGLGCAIAAHGAAHHRFGMDDLNDYTPVHALGHPFGQMISFAGLLFNGVFDRYPNAKFGFLEGGIAWLLLVLERFDRSHESHAQYDPRGELGPKADEKVSEYILKHIKEGRIFVGCEGGERDIAYAVKSIGADPFVYSSDFPHEVNNEICKKEIGEIVENDTITRAEKEAILAGNSERFYRFKTSPVLSGSPTPVVT
jgi:uncharacterized protein